MGSGEHIPPLGLPLPAPGSSPGKGAEEWRVQAPPLPPSRGQGNPEFSNSPPFSPYLAEEQQRVQAPALEDEGAADDADHGRHHNVGIARDLCLHVAHLRGRRETRGQGQKGGHAASEGRGACGPARGACSAWQLAHRGQLPCSLLALYSSPAQTCNSSTPHPMRAAPSTREGDVKSTLTMAMGRAARARDRGRLANCAAARPRAAGF